MNVEIAECKTFTRENFRHMKRNEVMWNLVLEDLPEQNWSFLKLFRDKQGDNGFLSKLQITHNPVCTKFALFAHVRAFLMFFTSYQRKEVAQREDFISCKAELSCEHWTDFTEHKKGLTHPRQHFLQWRREQKTRKKKP